MAMITPHQQEKEGAQHMCFQITSPKTNCILSKSLAILINIWVYLCMHAVKMCLSVFEADLSMQHMHTHKMWIVL